MCCSSDRAKHRLWLSEINEAGTETPRRPGAPGRRRRRLAAAFHWRAGETEPGATSTGSMGDA